MQKGQKKVACLLAYTFKKGVVARACDPRREAETTWGQPGKKVSDTLSQPIAGQGGAGLSSQLHRKYNRRIRIQAGWTKSEHYPRNN
jgi:hypothetical protein